MGDDVGPMTPAIGDEAFIDRMPGTEQSPEQDAQDAVDRVRKARLDLLKSAFDRDVVVGVVQGVTIDRECFKIPPGIRDELSKRRLNPRTIATEIKRIVGSFAGRMIRNPVGVAIKRLRDMPEDMTPEQESTWWPSVATLDDAFDQFRQGRRVTDRAVAFVLSMGHGNHGQGISWGWSPSAALCTKFNDANPQHSPVFASTPRNRSGRSLEESVFVAGASIDFVRWCKTELIRMASGVVTIPSFRRDVKAELSPREPLVGWGDETSLYRLGGTACVPWPKQQYQNAEQLVDDGFVSFAELLQNGPQSRPMFTASTKHPRTTIEQAPTTTQSQPMTFWEQAEVQNQAKFAAEQLAKQAMSSTPKAEEPTKAKQVEPARPSRPNPLTVALGRLGSTERHGLRKTFDLLVRTGSVERDSWEEWASEQLDVKAAFSIWRRANAVVAQ